MDRLNNMSLQLPLGIGIRDDATFANYFKGNNSHLLECLQDCVAGVGEQFIYIWGVPGVGRSHLLQACCHVACQRQQHIAYLPLGDYQQLNPIMLEGLEQLSLVCVDDLNAVLGKLEWEEALFHFYNRIRATTTRFIIVSDVAPGQLKCRLSDLQSRLSSGLIFQVQPLTDEQMILALQMRAYHRGLHISRDVGQYLIRHFPRNMRALFDILVKLDRASLIAKRRLTIPFVKQVMRQHV